MAQDDTLRMVAEVVDRFSSPLRNLRGQLQGMSREGAAHAETLGKGFNRLEGAAASAARTTQTVLTPALSSVGITALTVTGAIAGIGAAMRSFGTSAAQVAQLGRDTGIAAQQLREIQGILGKVGVDANQSGAAITQFAENMRQARRGIGPIMDFLRTQGGRSAEGRAYFDGLAESLRTSRNNGEALSKALEALEHIQDPSDRRKYAESILGIGDAARLTDGHLGSLREQIERFRRDNGILSQSDIDKAEAYDKAMSGLRGSMNRLGDAIAREALPHLTDLAKNLKSFLDDERQGVTPAIVGTIREIATWLRSIDWKGAFSAAGEGFSQLKKDLGEALTEVRNLLTALGKKDTSEALRDVFREIGAAARDTATAIRSVALALNAVKDLKDGNFSEAFKKLGEIDRLTQMQVGPRKNAEPSQKPTAKDEELDAMIRGQSGSAEDQRQAENLRANAARVREIEARQQIIRDRLGNFDRLGQGAISERSRQEAERLRDEMVRLTAELKRLREGQAQQKRDEATAQKSSAEGEEGPFLGARIQTASFGGMGRAAAVGRLLGDRRGAINLPEGGGRFPRVSPAPGGSTDRLGRMLRGEEGGDLGLPGSPGGLAGRDFGGGRFGLGGPTRPGGMLRPGGPGERVGRAMRGEGGSDGRTNARSPEGSGLYRPQYPLSDADLDQRVVNTIAGEVSTKNAEGVDAVINNMLNRVGTKGWGPSKNLLEVARAPGQYAGYRRAGEAESEFVRSRIKAIASGGVPDNTGGSNSYRSEAYYRQTQGRGKGYWAGRAEIGPNVGGNRYAFEPGFRNGPYAPYAEGARPQTAERADGEGFSARMRAMRSFEGNDFASEVRRRQGEADERAKAFNLGTETKMQSALRAGVGAATPNVNANGSVQIDIREPGPNTKVRTSASGDLFRTVKLNKGRTMAEASQEN